MSLLSVAEARARLLHQAHRLSTETVPIGDAGGRVLGAPLEATRTQPPFDVSAMDGFAVQAGDVAALPSTLKIVGQAAAGHGFTGTVQSGEAVRIFTGAPLPKGADAIVVQENTHHTASSVVVVDGMADPGHIRRCGSDFSSGQRLLEAGAILNARNLTLAAAMGHGSLCVVRRPRVAVLATGDELVMPGDVAGADQIVCSNPFGVAELATQSGAVTQFAGIARDEREDLTAKIRAVQDCDVLVTIGGASVGDHDLVGPVMRDLGMALDFWRIAMRPGKPLMYGRLGPLHVLGLPGNPVSSLICARIFLVPMIAKLLGKPIASEVMMRATVGCSLDANGPREHYMRATSKRLANGQVEVTPVFSQDSSLLSPLSAADVLIVRPPHDGHVEKGALVDVLPLDF